MTNIKAVLKQVRSVGPSLFMIVSFGNADWSFDKEYHTKKAYGEDKLLTMIRMDLQLFRQQEKVAEKLRRFIGKEISDSHV
jgi:hypothetical protein